MSNVKERPIILNAQEINAVLAGDKTQHRLPVLTAKEIDEGFEWDFSAEGDSAVCIKEIDDERQEVLLKPCPFGAIGDWFIAKEPYYGSFNNEHIAAYSRSVLLEITDIRIERVRDIDAASAEVEGCFNFSGYERLKPRPLSAFITYWMAKHGDDAWFTNPWVWVIDFKVIKRS